MMGSALTVLLIVVALISAVALTLVARSRPGGGPSDVRAFDHFIAVVEIVLNAPHLPGDNRRMRIEEGLRTAKIALLVMARGSRPVGWRARWHSRTHRRELRTSAHQIIKKIDRSNPLSGLREVDDELLATIVKCMIGICDGEIGEVSKSFEAAATPAGRARVPRISGAARHRARQFLGMILPLAIFLVLWYFKFPMSGAVITLLAGFCAVVLVLGAFWLLFPDRSAFLDGIKQILTSVSSAIPSSKNDNAAGGSVPEQRGPSEDQDPEDS
jgi:hypothetical protein